MNLLPEIFEDSGSDKMEFEYRALHKHDKKWYKKFKLYKEYKSIYNMEPKQSVVYKGEKIGSWCNNQRTKFREGTLREERRELLKDAGFIFYDNRYQNWIAILNLYKEFKEVHGREPLRNEVYKNVKLGIWYYNQKNFYKSNELPENKVKMLEEAGFVFGSMFDHKWHSNFEKFKEFKSKYNRNPKQSEEYCGVNLGAWLNNQKQWHAVGKLLKEREILLKEVDIHLLDIRKYRKE